MDNSITKAENSIIITENSTVNAENLYVEIFCVTLVRKKAMTWAFDVTLRCRKNKSREQRVTLHDKVTLCVANHASKIY